jgi:alpha-glucosidase
VHVDDQSVVFLRESAEESVLVLASRGDVDIELSATAVPAAARAVALHGDATLATASDGSALISAAGPVFAAWALPGVVLP